MKMVIQKRRKNLDLKLKRKKNEDKWHQQRKRPKPKMCNDNNIVKREELKGKEIK